MKKWPAQRGNLPSTLKLPQAGCFSRRSFNNILILFFIFSLLSCTPTPQSARPIINAYATSAATPWLTNLYTCAANTNVAINISAESPEIYLRLGEPETLVLPAYKIDEEEILVVVPRESAVQSLTLAEAQDLFAQGNPSGSAQVWVYASEADVQKVFDQLVMQGRSVSSSARIAVSVQNMSDVLKSDPTAIGILPRHLLTSDMREIFSVGHLPVLALTKEEPHGVIVNLISCLQGN